MWKYTYKNKKSKWLIIKKSNNSRRGDHGYSVWLEKINRVRYINCKKSISIFGITS